MVHKIPCRYAAAYVTHGDAGGSNQELPPNAPESVRELAEEFSHLKLGYRGDLKFWENPVIYEMTDLLEEPEQTSEMKMQ